MPLCLWPDSPCRSQRWTRGLCCHHLTVAQQTGRLAEFPMIGQPNGPIPNGEGSLTCQCQTPDPTGRYGGCAKCGRGILSRMLANIERAGI